MGLTARRYQSGEVDYSGRISKCGDSMLRAYLYEAAYVVLARVSRFSSLKSSTPTAIKENPEAALAVASRFVSVRGLKSIARAGSCWSP